MEGVDVMIAMASEIAAYCAILAKITLGSGATEYNWLYIVIAVGVIVGGIVAVNRWLSARAVRNQKLDELLTAVRFNGGDSLSVGDTVARTEAKVDALISTVAAQKGHTDTVEAEVWRRLLSLETRLEVRDRLAAQEVTA
jgi:hypothetical protein